MIRVLFVCLGNTCRSPLAEGIFAHIVQGAGRQSAYRIDSAGTGSYHTGKLPDPRTRLNAASHGLTLTHLTRTFTADDFAAFDHILVMDRQNEQRVLALARSAADEVKVRLMRDYDPEPGDGQVPDPWYGGEKDYEEVYQILERATRALFARLEAPGNPV